MAIQREFMGLRPMCSVDTPGERSHHCLGGTRGETRVARFVRMTHGADGGTLRFVRTTYPLLRDSFSGANKRLGSVKSLDLMNFFPEVLAFGAIMFELKLTIVATQRSVLCRV